MNLVGRAPNVLREVEKHLVASNSGSAELIRDLRAITKLFEGKKRLTSAQVAELLGVSSPNTIKNWLEGGYFPSAYQTKGGHWRFELKEVLAVKDELQAVDRRNASTTLEIPVIDDEDDTPVF